MDNLVIAYRVYEPELQMTSNVISVRDAVRLRTVDRKIQHYSNMLLKYSRKVYKWKYDSVINWVSMFDLFGFHDN